MASSSWTLTQAEINAIMSRATDQFLRTMVHVTGVPLSDGLDSLGPPEDAGIVCAGSIVASGEHHMQDREVWWHPKRQDGRLRVVR